MRPPAFVINLPRSTDRRARVARALEAAGLPGEIVEAVDGAGLEGGDAALADVPQPHLGRPLSLGEIGCLRSHLRVLERITRERPPVACIFEDDVVPDADAGAVAGAVLTASRAWDVLLLGHHSARRGPAAGAETCFARAPLIAGRATARLAEFSMGAYAYAVTPEGAGRLLAFADPLRMPMDWVIGYSPAAGVRLHAVTPPCVMPDLTIASTIAGREAGQRATPSARDAVRRHLGHAWLLARKAGVFPDSYVKRF